MTKDIIFRRYAKSNFIRFTKICTVFNIILKKNMDTFYNEYVSAPIVFLLKLLVNLQKFLIDSRLDDVKGLLKMLARDARIS